MGCMVGCENKVWHAADVLRQEVKSQRHREWNIGLLASVTSSELRPPENHQASQSSICTAQGVLNICTPGRQCL